MIELALSLFRLSSFLLGKAELRAIGKAQKAEKDMADASSRRDAANDELDKAARIKAKLDSLME